MNKYIILFIIRIISFIWLFFYKNNGFLDFIGELIYTFTFIPWIFVDLRIVLIDLLFLLLNIYIFWSREKKSKIS